MTRPEGPVPLTEARFTPSSAAIFRATGVALTSSDWAGAVVGAVVSASATGAAAAGFVAEVSIAPMTSPTASSSPVAPVAVSRPEAGLVISRVALSDSISRMISSLSTQSPDCFIQVPTVTSAIDSPGLGMVMSTLMAWSFPLLGFSAVSDTGCGLIRVKAADAAKSLYKRRLLLNDFSWKGRFSCCRLSFLNSSATQRSRCETFDRCRRRWRQARSPVVPVRASQSSRRKG